MLSVKCLYLLRKRKLVFDSVKKSGAKNRFESTSNFQFLASYLGGQEGGGGKIIRLFLKKISLMCMR